MNKYLATLLLSAALIINSDKDVKEKEIFYPEAWWGHKELMKKGVPEEVVRMIDGERSMMIAKSFNEKYVPKKWVKELSLKPWIDTYEKITKDKYYSQKESELIKSIEEKTLNGEHIFREEMESKENSASLFEVNNKTLLVVLKKYCDFFENPETGEKIKFMFPEGKESNEYIGVVRQDKKDFELYLIDTRWEDKYYPAMLAESKKNSVSCPSVIPYINHIGVLHSHSTSRSKGPEEVAGPSSRDIYKMKMDNEINPYQVNAVVTYLNDKEYNVDIYFSEIYKEMGYPMNTPYTFIYDLGVFKFDK